MYATFTILNYPRRFIFAGFFSMLFFRVALANKRKKAFYKLMGTGRNGGFDLNADLRQWTIMSFHTTAPAFAAELPIEEQIKNIYGGFIARWIRFFGCETGLFVLEICSGHGTWDNQRFADAGRKGNQRIPVAVLTRATIRLLKLRAFWKHVPTVNKKIAGARGLIFSMGAGEVPVIRQATFSIWSSVDALNAFAYRDDEHAAVVRKTRAEKWYSEELFLRMNILQVSGSVKGIALDKICQNQLTSLQ